jgi:hypothetical protein
MPSNYVPKNSLLGPTRVQRIAKKLIDEAAEDRQLALDAHRFFRQMVDEKNNVVKILNLVVKMEESNNTATKNSKGPENSVFTELDNLLNE